MSSISITLEIQYQIVLDAAYVFTVFLVAAVFIVTRAYRRIFKPLSNVCRKFNADSMYYRKPVPEENRKNFCCEVCDICSVEQLKSALNSFCICLVVFNLCSVYIYNAYSRKKN